MIFAPWISEYATVWDVETNLGLEALLILVGAVLGACLGSFAHATAWRLNRGISLFMPSTCDQCRAPLTLAMNLPIIGWLICRGKCRHCQQPIHFNMLLSEILMAFLAAFIITGFAWPSSALLISAMTFLWIAMISDADALVIDLRIIAIIAISGSVMLIGTTHPHAIFIGLAGLFVPAGCIYGLSLCYMIIRGERGFGNADPWLMAAIGIWTGAIGGILVFVGAAWIGVIYWVLIRLLRQKSIKLLPFGVLLGISFITYIIAGWFWMLMKHTV